MATPQLPSELVCRIISTTRFLERLENLHDSKVWRTVRWYVGNRDVQQVPPSWASSWFLELVRALMDPSVRFVHLRSSMAGHPDVIIDIDYDATNTWTHRLHTGSQIMALMVQQLLVK
ncbi:TPA: hypothetical protein ACH3X1_004314 [Trebouxia sp. C0004]